jgi:hypothetical protein
MPFTKPIRPIPTKIGSISISIFDLDGDANKITVRVGIDTLSAATEYSGRFDDDLLPHLTTAQKNGIISLLAAIRTKALAELL